MAGNAPPYSLSGHFSVEEEEQQQTGQFVTGLPDLYLIGQMLKYSKVPKIVFYDKVEIMKYKIEI